MGTKTQWDVQYPLAVAGGLGHGEHKQQLRTRSALCPIQLELYGRIQIGKIHPSKLVSLGSCSPLGKTW